MVWIWCAPQKDVCVEGLVSNTAVFRGGSFQNWFYCDGSNLTNGLIYWRVIIWCHCWEVVETMEGEAWFGKVGLGACLWRIYFMPTSSAFSASWPSWGEQLPPLNSPSLPSLPPCLSAIMLPHFHRPKSNKGCRPWTENLWNYEPKLIFLLFIHLCQVFCHSDEKQHT
jgi:hypothetical protein